MAGEAMGLRQRTREKRIVEIERQVEDVRYGSGKQNWDRRQRKKSKTTAAREQRMAGSKQDVLEVEKEVDEYWKQNHQKLG